MDTTKTMFALIDCNNFFVACEKVFQPNLRDVPAVVLSNNDGCIIARSNEVKKLGVPMGAPHFKWERLLKENGVKLFSANFHLYGDFSRRVVSILEQFTPDIEVYSVDESFLEVSSLLIDDYETWARELHNRVLKWTGIPVSVGMGPTKTLAKASAEYAKKHPETGSVFAATSDKSTAKMLKGLPIEDVWGIGRRLTPKLHRYGIKTAHDLIQTPDKWVQEQMTVRGLRVVKELKGESCIPLAQSVYDDEHEQKSIAATRSFGHQIGAIHELETAVANFAARASAKLRRRKQIAWEVTAFVRTGRQRYGEGYMDQPGSSHTLKLPYPTADTAVILHSAVEALKIAYQPETTYKKAGVILTKLLPETAQQTVLFPARDEAELAKRDQLMTAMDTLNQRYGKHTIAHAVQGTTDKQRWHSLRQHVSPAYTTRWAQIPKVKA